MAAAIIRYDRNSDLMRPATRALSMIREGRELLKSHLSAMIQTRDGDGSLSAHYDLTATLGVFQAGDYADANAAAKASFDELNSLSIKLNTDASVTTVLTALDNACAKHGVT